MAVRKLDAKIAEYRYKATKRCMTEEEAKQLQRATNEAYADSTRAKAVKKLIPNSGTGVVLRQYCTIEFAKNVSLGNNVYFNAGSHVIAVAKVSIGSNVGISCGSIIASCDHGEQVDLNILHAKPVVIEDNVLIYANVTVCKGSHIGHHVIVHANAKVHGHVLPFSIVHSNGFVETLPEAVWLANAEREFQQWFAAQNKSVPNTDAIIEAKQAEYAKMPRQQLSNELDVLFRQLDYWAAVTKAYDLQLDHRKATIATAWQELCISLLRTVDAMLHEPVKSSATFFALLVPTCKSAIKTAYELSKHRNLHSVKRRRQLSGCRSG